MELVDRGTVEQLFANYAVAIDDKQFDLIDDVFVEDGRWTSLRPDGDMVSAGRQEIKTFLQGARAAGQPRHVLTNLRLTAGDDGVALATVYLTFSVTKDNVFSTVATGTYRAEIVRDGGQWRFRDLVLSMDVNLAVNR